MDEEEGGGALLGGLTGYFVGSALSGKQDKSDAELIGGIAGAMLGGLGGGFIGGILGAALEDPEE